MKNILGAYAAGAIVLVLGTVLLGGVIVGLFWLTDTVAGINLIEQIAWFRPTVLWGGVTLIYIGAALCVGDMLGKQELYTWFWPVVAVAVACVSNLVLGEPPVTHGVAYAGAVALITIVVQRVRVTRHCAQF